MLVNQGNRRRRVPAGENRQPDGTRVHFRHGNDGRGSAVECDRLENAALRKRDAQNVAPRGFQRNPFFRECGFPIENRMPRQRFRREGIPMQIRKAFFPCGDGFGRDRDLCRIFFRVFFDEPFPPVQHLAKFRGNVFRRNFFRRMRFERSENVPALDGEPRRLPVRVRRGNGRDFEGRRERERREKFRRSEHLAADWLRKFQLPQIRRSRDFFGGDDFVARKSHGECVFGNRDAHRRAHHVFDVENHVHTGKRVASARRNAVNPACVRERLGFEHEEFRRLVPAVVIAEAERVALAFRRRFRERQRAGRGEFEAQTFVHGNDDVAALSFRFFDDEAWHFPRFRLARERSGKPDFKKLFARECVFQMHRHGERAVFRERFCPIAQLVPANRIHVDPRRNPERDAEKLRAGNLRRKQNFRAHGIAVHEKILLTLNAQIRLNGGKLRLEIAGIVHGAECAPKPQLRFHIHSRRFQRADELVLVNRDERVRINRVYLQRLARRKPDRAHGNVAVECFRRGKLLPRRQNAELRLREDRQRKFRRPRRREKHGKDAGIAVEIPAVNRRSFDAGNGKRRRYPNAHAGNLALGGNKFYHVTPFDHAGGRHVKIVARREDARRFEGAVAFPRVPLHAPRGFRLEDDLRDLRFFAECRHRRRYRTFRRNLHFRVRNQHGRDVCRRRAGKNRESARLFRQREFVGKIRGKRSRALEHDLIDVFVRPQNAFEPQHRIRAFFERSQHGGSGEQIEAVARHAAHADVPAGNDSVRPHVDRLRNPVRDVVRRLDRLRQRVDFGNVRVLVVVRAHVRREKARSEQRGGEQHRSRPAQRNPRTRAHDFRDEADYEKRNQHGELDGDRGGDERGNAIRKILERESGGGAIEQNASGDAPAEVPPAENRSVEQKKHADAEHADQCPRPGRRRRIVPAEKIKPPQRDAELRSRVRKSRAQNRFAVFWTNGFRQPPHDGNRQRGAGEKRDPQADFVKSQPLREIRENQRRDQHEKRNAENDAPRHEKFKKAAEERGVDRVVDFPPGNGDAHRVGFRVAETDENRPHDGREHARQQQLHFRVGAFVENGLHEPQTDFRRVRRERQLRRSVRQFLRAVENDLHSRGNADAQIRSAERTVAVNDVATPPRVRRDPRFRDDERRHFRLVRKMRFQRKLKRTLDELIRAEKNRAAALHVILANFAERQRCQRMHGFAARERQHAVRRYQNRSRIADDVKQAHALKRLRLAVRARFLEARGKRKFRRGLGRERNARRAVGRDAPFPHVLARNGKHFRAPREREPHLPHGNAVRRITHLKISENFFSGDFVDARRNGTEHARTLLRTHGLAPVSVAHSKSELRRILGVVFLRLDFREIFRGFREQTQIFSAAERRRAENEMRLREQTRAQQNIFPDGRSRGLKRHRNFSLAEHRIRENELQQAIAFRSRIVEQLVARHAVRFDSEHFQLDGNENPHFVKRGFAHFKKNRLRRRNFSFVENPAHAGTHDQIGADEIRLHAEFFRLARKPVNGNAVRGNVFFEKIARLRERRRHDLRHSRLRHGFATNAVPVAQAQVFVVADADGGKRQTFPVRPRGNEPHRMQRPRELAHPRLRKHAQAIFPAFGLAELNEKSSRAVFHRHLLPRKNVASFRRENFALARHFKEQRRNLALRNGEIQLRALLENARRNLHFGNRVERIDAGGKFWRRRDARTPAQIQRAARRQEAGKHAVLVRLRDRNVVRRENRVRRHSAQRIRRDLRHGNAEIHAPPAVRVFDSRVELQIDVEFAARGKA